MKNNFTIPVAIVIAGIIIAVSLYSSDKPADSGENKDTNKDKTAETSSPLPINKNDHVLGNPNAQLAIIEFSDTECPFCKRFHNTMQQVMDEYGKEGKVKWAYRHFPLDRIHSKARKEAEATECAAELGGNEKFWKYIDRLYEITPSNNGLDLKQLPEIAEYVGLDRVQFEECLESGRTAQKVKDDYEDGISAGVRGTPYSVIIDKKGNKTPLSGALPYSQVKEIIDQLLSE